MSALTTARGDRVVYDDLGAPGVPTALFVAGAGPARADDPITPATGRALASLGGRALIADRLGRGESVAAGPVDLEAQLAAIAELAATADAPVALVGHSSGCAVSILAAPRVPELAGLVLWEAPLGLFPGGAPAWWAGVRAAIDAGDLETAVARYMAGMPPEWLEELKRSPAYPDVVLAWAPDGEALARVEQRGYAEALREVAAPVVAVVGEETFPGMRATADALAAAASDGAAESLVGAGHAWRPEAMAARLARLLGLGAA